MYDRFKNEVIAGLSDKLGKEEIKTVLQVLDMVACRYKIEREETEIAAYNGDVQPLVRTYLACKKIEGLSEGTLYNYGRFLSRFFAEIRKPPARINANEIRVYLYQYQTQHKISNRTLDQYREYITRFFKWANEEGYLQTNPAKVVRPIKYEAKPRQALEQIELEYLRKACKDIRERAIIEFLYSTGCRVSELTAVKRSDVDWNAKTVHLFGKGKKHRTGFLNAKAEFTLREYLDSREDDNEFLFVSERAPHHGMKKEGVEKIVREISKRMPPDVHKKITPHVIRHTTATTALRNGMPIEDISKMLGHAKLDTTMIYAQTSVDEVQANHKKCVL